MIICELHDGRILCDLTVGKSSTKITALIDTGSPISLLSAGHIKKILGTDFQTIKEFEKDKRGKLIYPYKSEPIRLVPCYIRNVNINTNMFVKEFYFGLTEFKDGSAIIGLDLLSACDWTFDKLTHILRIDNLNDEDYKLNILRYFNTDHNELEELCAVFNNSISNLLKKAEGN